MTKSELNKIIKNKKITHCYISKDAYYRPGSAGYTDYRSRAGIYTKAEAFRHAERCKELTLIPIDNQEHNAMIIAEINDLLTRFIYPKVENGCPGLKGISCP